jgi:hypothetical protein
VNFRKRGKIPEVRKRARGGKFRKCGREQERENSGSAEESKCGKIPEARKRASAGTSGRAEESKCVDGRFSKTIVRVNESVRNCGPAARAQLGRQFANRSCGIDRRRSCTALEFGLLSSALPEFSRSSSLPLFRKSAAPASCGPAEPGATFSVQPTAYREGNP